MGLRRGAGFSARVSATMREGRVTLSARDVSLREVLTEFGRASGIEMHLEASVTADESTTIAFDRMPPEEGLRRLLRAKNFVFVYSGSSLAEVRTYTEAGGIPPSADGCEAASIRRRARALGRAGADAPARDRAIRVRDAERREAFRLRAQALGDPDPDERAAGLDGAGREATTSSLPCETATQMCWRSSASPTCCRARSGCSPRVDPVPIEPLLAFVNANRVPDTAVRIQALELMADRGQPTLGSGELLATLASGDRNQEVRESAQNLLENLTND